MKELSVAKIFIFTASVWYKRSLYSTEKQDDFEKIKLSWQLDLPVIVSNEHIKLSYEGKRNWKTKRVKISNLQQQKQQLQKWGKKKLYIKFVCEKKLNKLHNSGKMGHTQNQKKIEKDIDDARWTVCKTF